MQQNRRLIPSLIFHYSIRLTTESIYLSEGDKHYALFGVLES